MILCLLLALSFGIWGWPAQEAGCEHFYKIGTDVVGSDRPLKMSELDQIISSIADTHKYYPKYSGHAIDRSVSICVTDMKKVQRFYGIDHSILGYYNDRDKWVFVGHKSLRPCNTDLAHELSHAHNLHFLSGEESQKIAYGFEQHLRKIKKCKG